MSGLVKKKTHVLSFSCPNARVMQQLASIICTEMMRIHFCWWATKHIKYPRIEEQIFQQMLPLSLQTF